MAKPTTTKAQKVTTTSVRTKQAKLIELLARPEGASLDQMVAATGWLPHTTRAAMTMLKKKGYSVTSEKRDNVRTYRAIAPVAA